MSVDAWSRGYACRKCGRTVHNHGVWLERVNEKGVPGIWECRPNCIDNLSQDQAMIGAITGRSSKAQP